jgi:peptide/nickel transport system permease protein
MSAAPISLVARIRRSTFVYQFLRSRVAMVAAVCTLLIVASAVLAPWVAPHHPFDPRTLDLMDARTPPLQEGFSGKWFLMGADDQGRDMFSTILYGARISLLVGFLSILFAMVVGVTLGLIGGYIGGVLDAIIMRIADIQLSFPAILIALLIDGIARTALPRAVQDELGMYVVIFAIGMSLWVHFARTVRSSTLVETQKDYVLAARILGVGPFRIMLRHVLPNVLSPVLVIATIGLALAILNEATLSFLGVGVPPTRPSLGTLIRIGNEYLFSGEWWITIFPGLTLVLLVLSVNILGDWLRDVLNPKLQ